MNASLLWIALLATSPAEPETLARIVTLPEVSVSTSRAGSRTPVARSVLTRDQLTRDNWGQDTPMALATTPGAYAYSDAGNGIGYSYLSIRGFPQRRISVLINGVPLNDPESHEVYWIDHPDLLASTSEAQVQRGVGSALYGAASVGGSVNMETSPFGDRPRATMALGTGTFDTRRAMLEADSGPLANDWNLYGRYSRIETDGYRDQSWTRLWSYFLAGRKRSGSHALTLNLYGGPEETHLAYLGVPQPYLDGAITGDERRDRRVNLLSYPGEADHFFEPHYELIHTWTPAAEFALTQTLFYFDGRGYYDEQRFGHALSDYRLSPWATTDSTLVPRDYYAQDGTGALTQDGSGRFTVERFDVVRRRTVENQHYGWVPRVRWSHAGGALTIGGEIRAHDGRHYGQVISGNGLPPGTEPDHAYYDYHPRTFAGGLFAREEWSATSALLVTADLGWRHEGYTMQGDRYGAVTFTQPYDFAVPRLGVTWTPRSDVSLFGAWAHSSREPAFRDLFDAEGAGSVPLFANGTPLVRPEKVNDLEAGATWRRDASFASVNLFRMDFRDELVYAGQFNTDLGYPILGNAARSVHQGVELAGQSQARLVGDCRVLLEANVSLSDNHFVEYTEHYGPTPADDVSYDGKALGFFPATLANVSARVEWHGATLGAQIQSAGRIYLDNNEDANASIAPHTVLNLSAAYRAALPSGAHAQLGVRVFNALDRLYSTGGYFDYDQAGNYVAHYVPAATRSVLAELRVEF